MKKQKFLVQALKAEKVSQRRCLPFYHHFTHFHLVFACLSSVSDCLDQKLDARKRQSNGTKCSLSAVRKLVVGDKGYRGEPEIIS
jgi:murein endopeptidase